MSYTILAALLLSLIVATWISPITYRGDDLNPLLLALFLLWGLGIGCRRLHAEWIAGTLQSAAILMLMGGFTALLTAILATTNLPLADGLLARVDESLIPGWHWDHVMRTLATHATLLLLLAHAYVSLNWQPLLLILVLHACGRMEMAWRFIAAWGLTLLISTAIFPFLPAEGGYVHYAIHHADLPAVKVEAAWHPSILLHALRDGFVTSLDRSTLEGLVTMPSFHAAAAVLMFWSFRDALWLRWPGMLLNATMLASVVPIGGHYVIDAIAGGFVAVLTIALAKQCDRRDVRARANIIACAEAVAIGLKIEPERALGEAA